MYVVRDQIYQTWRKHKGSQADTYASLRANTINIKYSNITTRLFKLNTCSEYFDVDCVVVDVFI